MTFNKLQSASEFLSIYGFAILGIAIFSIILYFLLTVPSSSVPNQCSFSGYLSCKDIAIGSNSISSRAVFLFTNIQQYAIANAIATINMSNVGSFSGKCSPNVILPGGDLECVINFGVKITPNQLAKGTLSLNDKVCTSTSGNTCGSTVPQSYGGTFTTHIAPLVPPPKCSISLDVQNTTAFTGAKDELTANVKILGYAISGATVNFTSTSSNVFFTPSLVNTNSNGNSTTYALSNNPLTGETLSATYANCTATNTITFVKPIYVAFTANIIGNKNDGIQYQSEVVNINSKQYSALQLPTQITAVSGTPQQYAYSPTIPSTLTSTQYYYISTNDGCGASQISQTISPSTSCNVIGNYGTQYFLTTSTSPSAGGTITPSSEWVDSGNQITIAAAANTGYTFAGFTGTGTGSYTGSSSSVPVIMDSPVTETANFNINHYNLILNPSSCAGVSGQGTYDYGTTVDIGATAPTGYSFNKWTGTGTVSYTGSSQSSSVLMDSNIIETANCTINHYSLTESASPAGAGTVSPGSDSYVYGSNVVISASPASGYEFAGWSCTGTGCYSGSNVTKTITIFGNTIETANYLPATRHTIYYNNPGIYTNFTTPSGTTTSTVYTISLVGAGGGGADGTAPSSGGDGAVPGTGGGGGAYLQVNVSGLAAGTTITVNVGAGGGYTINGGNSGGSTSASAPGFTATAGGGAGGQSEWSSTFISGGYYCANIAGGAGGSSSVSGSNVNVLINDQGQSGQTTPGPICEGYYNNGGNSGGNQGTGGVSAFSVGQNGNPGSSYGGAGGGGGPAFVTYVAHTGAQGTCDSTGTQAQCTTNGSPGAGGRAIISWMGPS